MAVYFDHNANRFAGPGKATEFAGLEIEVQYHHLLELREVFEAPLLKTLRQAEALVHRPEELISTLPATICRAAV